MTLRKRLRTRSLRLLLASAMVCSAGQYAFGQAQNTGTIAGNVTDIGHGVVPNAQITLTSEDRGNLYHAVSNAQGEFTFNDVPVGSYFITVQAPSFSTFVTRHVAVDSDTRLRIDAELKAGNVDTQVEVTADALSVDTQSATLGQVLDNELVENLPIDGNNIVALAALLPGVVDVSAPTTYTDENGGPSFSANGARGNSNLFLLDGLLWNNLYLNTAINYPNHAALTQVSIQLNNFSAQYGRNSGSIFNVVTKQGSNLIHGQAYLHYEDSIFNAQNYFSSTKPPQHTYQFGLQVGGPIIRDKLFFSALYQGLIGFSAVQANAETLSYAERGLNPDGTARPCTSAAFAGYAQCASFAGDARDPSLVPTLIANPVIQFSTTSFGSHASTAISQLNSTWTATGHTGTNPCVTLLLTQPNYLPNAEVPSICFDPTIQNVLKGGYVPLPNTQLGGSQFLYSSAQSPRPQSENGGLFRVDWNVTPRNIIDARFYKTENSDLTANGGSNQDTGVPTYEVDANSAHITAGSMGETMTVTSNMVNVVRLGYKRYEYLVNPTDSTTLGSFGSTFSAPGIPSLPTIVVNTRFNLGNSAAAYTHSVNENIEFLDNVSYVHGRHNMQFGMDYLRLQYLNQRDNPGTFNFYGNPGYTNAQASDAIFGLLYSESVGNRRNIAAVQHALYSYVQDDWRATRRLTVNAGIRYEIPWMWYQPKGQAATFIRGFQSTVFKNAPAGLAFVGDPGIPKSLVNTDYTNLSPRIGLAYDVFGDGKTAIRAGFGTFYDAVPATVVGTTQPFTYSANYQYPNGSITNPLLGQNPIPSDFTPATATFSTPYSTTFPDRNFRSAYVLGFNLGFQQQIRKGTILEANYLGRLARHLTMPFDLNSTIVDCSGTYFQSNPVYCPTTPTANYAQRVTYPGYNYGGGGVVDFSSEGTGNYHALQVIYRQRSYKTLTTLVSYTYSRTLDLQSNVNTNSSTPTPNNIALQYGPADQNTTHIFNMGYVLKLPSIRNASSLVKSFVNDWTFNGIYNARTGHPVNLTFGGDIVGNDEQPQRVYQLPGTSATLPSNRHRKDKINQWFNTAAFVKPANFTLGNVGRNSIVGPAYINTTFSLTKSVQMNRLHEGMHAQVRVEAYNVFNTVNLGQPRSTYSSSSAQATTFGTINAGGTNQNRRLQFGFILYF